LLLAALHAPVVVMHDAVDFAQSVALAQYVPLLGEPFEQTPQSESAAQVVTPSAQSLAQSVALVHDFVPTAQAPPVGCAGQSLSTLHCFVPRVPPAIWHSEYAAHGVDVLEQVLVP
jgi:hypothetical protein